MNFMVYTTYLPDCSADRVGEQNLQEDRLNTVRVVPSTAREFRSPGSVRANSLIRVGTIEFDAHLDKAVHDGGLDFVKPRRAVPP